MMEEKGRRGKGKERKKRKKFILKSAFINTANYEPCISYC